MPENRIYTIINYEDVTDEMFEVCIEKSRDNLRHTVKGTDRVILKWYGDRPYCIPSGCIEYTNEGISEVIDDPEGDW